MIRNNNSIHERSIIRNSILSLLLIFISYSVISAQKISQPAPPLRERLFFGGSFGLQFGTITNINVSPIIGLWVLPRVAIGIGPDYMYYKDQYMEKGTSIYGGKVYSELVLIQDFNNLVPAGVHMGLFLHAEYESLSLESAVWNSTMKSDRFITSAALAGPGISQQLGQRSSLNLMVLWIVGSSDYQYYSNPEIRISFNF